jgi:hypothetical protein
LGEEVRAVVVEIRVTTCVTMFEVLVAKVPETPWYTASTNVLPSARLEVE